jgi:hypothetical protein
VKVETHEGTFVATDNVDVSGFTSGKTNKVSFSTFGSSLEVSNSREPKYFAIPLVNFLWEFSHRLLIDHPLRIHPTPRIPDTIPENMRLAAALRANEKNRVIGFQLDGALCFIEPLPDYEARKSSLMQGEQRRVTAVLVGELHGKPASSWEELRIWGPFEALPALGFAAGSEVSSPWIEVRDEDGHLIRRIFASTASPGFAKGTALLTSLSNGPDSGIGAFLTSYLSLPKEKRHQLKIVMDHARLGTVHQPRVQDALDHLVRALECLCKEHGVSRQDLLKSLGGTVRNSVDKLLRATNAELKLLQKDCSAAQRWSEARYIETIRNRVLNAGAKEAKFGLAVAELLKKFRLPDADLIDKFYQRNPRKDGKDWPSVLTDYRGATIHEGAMDFARKHDIADVFRISRHLQDLLARLTLKEMGYQGSYQPAVSSYRQPSSLDWVTIDTDPSLLGYK